MPVMARLSGLDAACLHIETPSTPMNVVAVVRAGGEQWDVPLEIRLYRCSLVHKPGVEKLWRQMMKLPRDFLEA